jgi:GT2 family glycosyltransferase
MVRRSALERIGGWDERYWMWYEDVDIARRLATIGPALYVPDAVFEHVGRASTRGWRRHEQHRRLYHGTMVYAHAHLSKPAQMLVAATMIAVCIPRFLVYRAIRDDAADSYRGLISCAIRMLRFHPIPEPQVHASRPDLSQ